MNCNGIPPSKVVGHAIRTSILAPRTGKVGDFTIIPRLLRFTVRPFPLTLALDNVR